MNKVFSFVFNCTLVLCLIFGSFSNSVLADEQQASSVNTAPVNGTETVEGVYDGGGSSDEASEQPSTEERETWASGMSRRSDNVPEEYGCPGGGTPICYKDDSGVPDCHCPYL